MSMVFAADTSGQGAQPIAMANGLWVLTGTLTLSGSYASGGDTVDLRKYSPGGATIRKVFIPPPIRSVNATYDLTNLKIRLWTLNPAGATSDVAPVELAAAAYDADLAVVHDVMLWLKV
jgi:hypothetical protein